MSDRLPRLFINHIPEHDWLIALEFGRVDEGQPPDCWAGVDDRFGFLREAGGERPVGFKILEFSAFDLDAPEVAAVWGAPYFDAPTLGLTHASAGEIALAVHVKIGSRPTLNRLYFAEALAAETDHDEVGEWLGCLEAGDCMAHYGLGIALLDTGEAVAAYDHLRYYSRIAPCSAWAHHWHGRAAMAIGELEEARGALARSIELETDDELMNQSRLLLVAIGE